VFTLSESFDDECKAEEEDVEFPEAGEDSAEALEPPEEALDLVAHLIEGPVILPQVDAIGFWRDIGIIPRLGTGCLVLAPSYTRSINMGKPPGIAPISASIAFGSITRTTGRYSTRPKGIDHAI
jgi:hypothetical protein